jgi:DNA-binding LacI/PurR family transcriptional regulator
MSGLSLKLLAEKMGVSSATISNALNNKGKISPQLRQRIIKVARESGYTISPHALALQGKRLNILGLMIASIEDGMAQKFFVGADRAAQEKNYSTILSISSHSQIGISEMELRSVQRFDTLKVGGVLYVPAADTEHLEVERIMEERGIPFVLLYRRRQSDESPAVIVDHAHGFRLGLEHLISLGHKRVGIVYVPSYRGPELLIARTVFKKTFPQLNWSQWHVPLDWEKIRGLIRQGATAFLTLSDDSAFTLEKMLSSHGYAVPRDISIIGFRDTIVARTMTPELTTIRVPAEEMGYAAAQWLVSQIEASNPISKNEQPPESIDLCVAPTLVVRESTAPPVSRSRSRQS